MVFSMSTRSRSLSGAQPQAIRYSCRRKSRPKPKISAPRRMVARAILRGRQILLPQFLGHQRERNTRQKQEQRSGEGSAQLRVHEESALPRAGAEPGVVAVGLKHQHAGQAPHPIDVGQPGWIRSRHTCRPRARRQYTAQQVTVGPRYSADSICTRFLGPKSALPVACGWEDADCRASGSPPRRRPAKLSRRARRGAVRQFSRPESSAGRC